VFAEWQLSRAASITTFAPHEDTELVAQAAQTLLPFAGDFCGGVLALDLRGGDVERAPVVSFDSEGGITVLGESFDDFLALIASDVPDEVEDSWTVSPALRAWIRASGVAPHASVADRLLELEEPTRRFWLDWTSALRSASARQRPQEVCDHVLILGERIGEVVLGMNRTALDAAWGTPNLPSWGQSTDGALAMYAGLPFTIQLDLHQQQVTGVTLYGGRHRATTPDGVHPMFMRAEDAMSWLSSLGVAPRRSPTAIFVPELGARFKLDAPTGARARQPWVVSIELTKPTA
jgi:hypothetical protein